MSSTTNNQIILVTILEGRNLPKKLLYVECKCNDEILSTDSIQGPNPIWDTELGWPVQQKQLSFLRSQRTNVKLVVYALGDAKSPIGYGNRLLTQSDA